MKKGFDPIKRCARCGQCCKNMGCHYSPDDFANISFESLKKEIEENGYISIDWWEDYPVRYFLRIRNKNASIVDPSWGGVCSILTDHGCPLAFDERPKGARFLEPRERECICHYSKKQCADDWYKYNDILIKLVNYFRNKEGE